MDTTFPCTVFGTKNASGLCQCIDEKTKWDSDECECKIGSDRSFCNIKVCSELEVKGCGRPTKGVCKSEGVNLLFSSPTATPICNGERYWFYRTAKTLAPKYDRYWNKYLDSKPSEKVQSKYNFMPYDSLKPPPTIFPTYSFGNLDVKPPPISTQINWDKFYNREPNVVSNVKYNYDNGKTYTKVDSDSTGFYPVIIILVLIVKILLSSCIIYARSKKRERQQGNIRVTPCNTSASLSEPPIVDITNRSWWSNNRPAIPLPYESLHPTVENNPRDAANPMPYYSLNQTIENNSLVQNEYIIAMPLNDFVDGQQSTLYYPVLVDESQSLVLDFGDPCDPPPQYGDVPQTPPPTYEESAGSKPFESANC